MLPPEVLDVLRDVVEAMAHGQAATIAPAHSRLTTKEAADLLGVSRSTLVQLVLATVPSDQELAGTSNAGDSSDASMRRR